MERERKRVRERERDSRCWMVQVSASNFAWSSSFPQQCPLAWACRQSPCKSQTVCKLSRMFPWSQKLWRKLKFSKGFIWSKCTVANPWTYAVLVVQVYFWWRSDSLSQGSFPGLCHDFKNGLFFFLFLVTRQHGVQRCWPSVWGGAWQPANCSCCTWTRACRGECLASFVNGKAVLIGWQINEACWHLTVKLECEHRLVFFV